MSSFGSFKFGASTHFGSLQVDNESLSLARSIMSRFHSDQVVNKDSEETLQFRYILALARGINTMQKEAIATHNDNFLVRSRVEHISDIWAPLLGILYNNDLTLSENIEFYQDLIKLFLTGETFNNFLYSGASPISIISAIYFFTKNVNVRIYEAWRDFNFMPGGTYEIFEIGALDPDSESTLGGAALLGPAGDIRISGFVQAGAQIIFPLDNLIAENTDGAVFGKELLRPVMSDLVLVYELTSADPGGVITSVLSMAFGRGRQEVIAPTLPDDLAFEVFRTAVFQTYTDDDWLPVPYATKKKRFFAIIPKEYIYGQVPITEAALISTSGSLQQYHTFPTINKDDNTDVLMSWNVDFNNA